MLFEIHLQKKVWIGVGKNKHRLFPDTTHKEPASLGLLSMTSFKFKKDILWSTDLGKLASIILEFATSAKGKRVPILPWMMRSY